MILGACILEAVLKPVGRAAKYEIRVLTDQTATYYYSWIHYGVGETADQVPRREPDQPFLVSRLVTLWLQNSVTARIPNTSLGS